MVAKTADEAGDGVRPRRVLCLGEALIDVVVREGAEPVEHVGGSPLNVSTGLARLGHAASICAWWGRDDRGHRLAEAAAAAGARVEPGSDGAAATSVAYARVDRDGRASYTFDLTWDVPGIAGLDLVDHLHTGSIAATLEPGGAKVVGVVGRARRTATVSYDPNIRPAIMGTPGQVLARVEDLVGLCDVVKASDEDLAWLYPEEPVEDVLRRWAGLGPALVVCTRGPWGAYALLRGNRDLLVVDPLTVPVADTVGAGDSFMAGLVSGLLEAGLLGGADARRRLRGADWSQVQPALHRAVVTSAITVSRAGSYAPTLAEVRDLQDADPLLS
ncbi:PfkB family carbohydrate kinase [Propionicicella superfundia]|uniref:PfkB family carbohydrate kinase n=1 Tax=Propionicicella superfundia TaxID=348582 RepID=UPI0003FA8AD4|nr:PfkB family carbohydrate kinase [Propionicicella superfundia]